MLNKIISALLIFFCIAFANCQQNRVEDSVLSEPVQINGRQYIRVFYFPHADNNWISNSIIEIIDSNLFVCFDFGEDTISRVKYGSLVGIFSDYFVFKLAISIKNPLETYIYIRKNEICGISFVGPKLKKNYPVVTTKRLENEFMKNGDFDRWFYCGSKLDVVQIPKGGGYHDYDFDGEY